MRESTYGHMMTLALIEWAFDTKANSKKALTFARFECFEYFDPRRSTWRTNGLDCDAEMLATKQTQ